MRPMMNYAQGTVQRSARTPATGERYSKAYQDATPPPSVPDTPTPPSINTYPTTPADSNMPSQTTTSPPSGNNLPSWINNLAFSGGYSKESPIAKQITGGQPPASTRPPQSIPPGGTSIGMAWKGYTRFNTDRPETVSNPAGLSTLNGSPNSGPRETGPNGVLPEPPNDTVAPPNTEPAPQSQTRFARAFQNTAPSAAGSAPNPSGVSPGGGKNSGNLFCCFRPVF